VDLAAKNNEAVETEGLAIDPPFCITQHPGFQAVCLNRWVIQMAWYQCKQQYRDSAQGSWRGGALSILVVKTVRVLLPSCAIPLALFAALGHTSLP